MTSETPSITGRPPGPRNNAPLSGPRPVPWISRLTPAVHGAVSESAGDTLDFSANGNVIGPTPAVREAIANVDLARYPDREARALRRAIAFHHSVPEDTALIGNGSTELIWAVARAFLAPDDTAVVLGPTYGEYAVASAACGAAVDEWTYFLPDAHTGAIPPFDVGVLAQRLARAQPKLVWLCHPNNPTGAPFPLEILAGFLTAAPATLFVVDEAYLPLAEGLPSAESLVTTERVVVLRSLTKDAGLAGLRVGYALAALIIADAVRRVIPPWSVNAFAQAAAVAALADRPHATQVQSAVAESRAHLIAGLTRLGLQPYPGKVNFVLVPVGDGAGVARALLARGFAVRDCASFGMPQCIRIGVRSISDQDMLLGALETILMGQAT